MNEYYIDRRAFENVKNSFKKNTNRNKWIGIGHHGIE